uniref:Serine/threonine-protein phosphatase 5 (Trinotate prediction) n=1 Tax=Henneguya salminicola TaxID=69463 RepID=A0A6G3MKS1_HENSL
MFDLLWTDPTSQQGRIPNPRGVTTAFGPDVTKAFCTANNLRYIIRSHESQMEGYSMSHEGQCITIFSAPNYCDEMGNKGAFIHLTKNLNPEFHQFEASPHPKVEKFANKMLL